MFITPPSCSTSQIDCFCRPLQTLPDEGIHVFAGLPHTHNLGRAMRLRHLRSGQEMQVPFQDRFYDPNYQTMRRFDMHLRPVSENGNVAYGPHLITMQ